ncbi:MAG: sugar phosphate isomerase/epimerase family protein [Eubacteriales bacterium]
MAAAIKRKAGLSIGGDLSRENLKKLKSAGFGAVEVKFIDEDRDKINWKSLSSGAREAGILLWSFHLPFLPFSRLDISSLDGDIRKNTLCFLGELIKRAGDAGIKNMVIHPSGEPIPDNDRGEKLKFAKETLFTLAGEASGAGGVLCVENLPRTCLGKNIEEILDLVSVTDKLRVCFDTNHLLGEGNTIQSFLPRVSDKLQTIHVSDYDFINERHWLPGEGKIDWAGFMDMLDEVRYSNPFIYEVGYESLTRNRPRPLENADFIKNFAELCQRVKPSVIE